MRDDQLVHQLDQWAEAERLSRRPLPTAVRERLRAIRIARHVTLGTAVTLVIAILGLLVWVSVDIPAEPPASPAPTEPIEEPTPTIGAIYSMNKGFAETSGGIVLPEPPSRDRSPVRSPAADRR